MAMGELDAQLVRASLALLCTFGALLTLVLLTQPSIFAKRHGRTHRLLGLCELAWLGLGVADCAGLMPLPRLHADALRLAYDVVLGVLGTVLTLSAADAFQHKGVVNRASGVLEQAATVTQGEMLEHAFCQGLNLVQILYLHALGHVHSPLPRVVLCMAATSPWLLRGYFPVNSFSANYRTSPSPWGLESVMYRIKKGQYMMYKHALLHGLNVSLALALPGTGADSSAIAQDSTFRLYWVFLNAAYVLEFFLQTLVKKGVLPQGPMLALNGLLMAGGTLAALPVLARVWLSVGAASLGLNVARRGHDLQNTSLVVGLALLLGVPSWP